MASPVDRVIAHRERTMVPPVVKAADQDQATPPEHGNDDEKDPPRESARRVDQGEQAHCPGRSEVQRHRVGLQLVWLFEPIPSIDSDGHEPQAEQRKTSRRKSGVENRKHELLPPRRIAAMAAPPATEKSITQILS